MGWSVYSCGMSIGLSEHENIHHEPLNDLEKAKSIKKLMEIQKITQKAAAALVGISESEVHMLLSLVDAPKEVMEIKDWSEVLVSSTIEIESTSN